MYTLYDLLFGVSASEGKEKFKLIRPLPRGLPARLRESTHVESRQAGPISDIAVSAARSEMRGLPTQHAPCNTGSVVKQSETSHTTLEMESA